MSTVVFNNITYNVLVECPMLTNLIALDNLFKDTQSKSESLTTYHYNLILKHVNLLIEQEVLEHIS